ncbi:serine/threonine-protein kinase [Paractinoplanes lichenicola]|uniref:non-specific serine/threonine protein kinase n=1 Tax=Paractinoplanes lichenicola TaxID=2802976 RepID=A0ABS1VWQ6_9ACTN|nr:serine/threonine-protein kinase [Actinoplanes lichenicola]MBL7258922.1 serine/threonine protein kinase [Actinoplanes lichenicola]
MPLIAGRYRLGETLGTGGMGTVWRARDEVLDRDVAVKEVLLPEGVGHIQRRTLREARASARLGHPNVVRIFDVFEVDGRMWIVMEYVPSRSLQEELRLEGPMDPRRAARIGLDLLAALRAAHAAGVDHRDVKPANVLLADDGRVLLTDFGIATIEGDSLISSSDMLLGSPEYMSPERAKFGTAGMGSDLWSLGATLYAAVEGRSPFHRGNALATLTALAADEPDPPKQAGALEPLLMGLLQKDPAARLDAAAVEHGLRAALAGAYGHGLVPVRDAAVTTHELDVPPSPANTDDSPADSDVSSTDADDSSADANVSPADADVPRATALGIPAQRSAPDDAPAYAAASVSAPERIPDDPVTRSGRRWIVLASVAAAALLAAAVWGVTRPDDSTPEGSGVPATSVPAGSAPESAQPSATPSAPASPSSSPSVATTTTAPPGSAGSSDLPALPDGWRDYRDPTGFAVYVPAGWNRSKEGSIVYFRRGSQVLGIDQTKKPVPDPVADWRGKADYRVSIGDFPSYREIRIDEVDYFTKAADWEFTFTRNGVRQHVNNRGVITSPRQAYGFYWQTRDDEWSAHQDDLELIFDSFRPAD